MCRAILYELESECHPRCLRSGRGTPAGRAGVPRPLRKHLGWHSLSSSYKIARHMNSVVSDKPYVPVPPYHGTLWPRALNWYIPRYLRRRYGTAKIDVVGAEKLRTSM